MSAVRTLVLALLGLLAVILQVTIFRFVAIDGVVPNLALVLVVAAAFARGPSFAATLGFGVGLLLDLAPPADHTAGRWALALVLVGYLAGRVRQDANRSMVAALVTVAAASFIGTSVYALSGAILGDDAFAAGDMFKVIVISVLWDVLIAPVALPLVAAVLRRIRPPQLAY